MPLDFLERRGDKSQPSVEVSPAFLPEDIEAEEHELKLTYRAKTSQGVRMAAGPNALDELPNMLLGLTRSAVEVVEPLELDFAEAAPVVQKPEQAMQWINANHERSPMARHALVVLESVDGWGGPGVRGDTDRAAQKILANLLANVLASQHAAGFTPAERPVPSGGSGGLICAHCGFASAHERAFYCPRCGMRMVRG
ncbi:hypothetical protein BH24CHL8_BH24CHL8_05490 [soil metagenome]